MVNRLQRQAGKDHDGVATPTDENKSVDRSSLVWLTEYFANRAPQILGKSEGATEREFQEGLLRSRQEGDGDVEAQGDSRKDKNNDLSSADRLLDESFARAASKPRSRKVHGSKSDRGWSRRSRDGGLGDSDGPRWIV